MNKLEFYTDLHYKTEDKKNEINNSLSLPITIISGLIAAFFYILTTFDFKLKILNSVLFVIVTVLSLAFLCVSVFNLMKSYTNFHQGYGYKYLADANDLNNYQNELTKYYQENKNLKDLSEEDFEEYVIQELILNTDQNQKYNKIKSHHRHLCLKYLTLSFLILCFNLLLYSYNYVNKKEDEKNVIVKIKEPIEIKDNFKKNNIFTDSLTINSKKMADEKNPPKPTPPPSQIIKEGQNPIPKPQIPPKPKQ